MRKLLCLLLFVFCFCSCEYNDIANSLYVGSIHLAYEDEYVGTFFVPNSMSIGKSSEGNKVSNDYITVKDSTIPRLFSQFELSSEMQVNFNHISSIILDESFITKSNLTKLCLFFRESAMFDYNFYLFASKENVKDIYSHKLPNQESVLNTLILSPVSKDYLYLATPNLHFLRFCSMVFGLKCVRIPVLSLGVDYLIEDEKEQAYICNGVCYFTKEPAFYYVDEYPGLGLLLNHSAYEVTINNASVSLKRYRIKYQYNNNLSLRIAFQYSIEAGKITKDEVKTYVSKEIFKCLKIGNSEDMLSLAYYNHAYKKNITYSDISVVFGKIEEL